MKKQEAPVIHPTGIYSTAQLRQLLDIGEDAVRAAKKHGLRFSRRFGRDLFLGSWVLDWLAEGAVHSPPATEG